MNSDLLVSVNTDCDEVVDGWADTLATGFLTILFRFRETRKVKKSTEPKEVGFVYLLIPKVRTVNRALEYTGV